ncbi:MAG TPA: tetratricopeptide repeat protein [Rhizomicrobium sp.]|nr:tetratricopeptide repeat protein [Rhizomicrobium sp.]
MDLQQVYSQARQAQKEGDLSKAERLYRRILEQAAMPEVLVNLGNVLAAQNRRDEALASFDRALQARPDLFEALYNRANTLLDLHRPAEALENYDRVIALRPDFPSGWNNRGTALRRLRRLEESLASYDHVVRLAPAHVNAHTNRAIVLFDLGKLDQALPAADAALALQANFSEALYIKANILRDLGRLKEARECFRRILEIAPQHGFALNGLAQTAASLCDWTQMSALAPRLESDIQAGHSLIQPFVMMGYTEDAALLRRCAENYIHRMAPAQPALWNGQPYGHHRIRLAYLSADFHIHPTAQLMVELFERHDRARFEVSAFAFGPDDNSSMRRRLVKAFDRFEDVRRLSDLEVAHLLRSRAIDIAVDLNGHTHGARPGIFSHRPAPVQVNYLVYPGTIGAPYMDYILADRTVLPLDQQPHFSEKIVHLPDCYQANDATRPAPAPPSRAEAGLPASGFVFCCFNNNWKITAPLFDIWMRLLQQVPGSVLWLLDSPARDNLSAHATARGVDAGRLIFAPRLRPDQHLARYPLADLFLDTLPYNAHTTCSDALWAGLPVITCYGKAFQGRVAASLLKAIDLPELVTARLADYETLALELAGNPTLLKATREKLARNRRTTPLYDSERFRRNIEAAYEAMLS